MSQFTRRIVLFTFHAESAKNKEEAMAMLKARSLIATDKSKTKEAETKSEKLGRKGERFDSFALHSIAKLCLFNFGIQRHVSLLIEQRESRAMLPTLWKRIRESTPFAAPRKGPRCKKKVAAPKRRSVGRSVRGMGE